MAVLSILQVSTRERIVWLDAELNGCTTVQGKMRNAVREFLIQEGIYSVKDITDEVKLDFADYLDKKNGFSEGQKAYYVSALEMLQLHYYSPLHEKLLREIEKNINPSAALRKAETYLMSHNISSVQDIDFEIRCAYEAYLTKFLVAAKVGEYLKVLDVIKLNAIRHECESSPFRNRKLEFSERKIFLLYHPDYTMAMSFYYIRNKEELLFDFSLPAPVKMKRQIARMLNHILSNVTNRHDRRERFLIPLKLLYQFCMEQGIEDLERLEEHQIEAFKERLIAIGNTLDDSYIQIVENIRKFLFLDAAETNWEANVWYMERFNLQSDRMNPSNPIFSIPFFQVHNLENRKYLQDYLQYLIGMTNMSLASIRTQFYRISEFLKYCDSKNLLAVQVTTQDMDQYLKYIDENIQAVTFNGKAADTYKFFRFLMVRGHIVKMPFVLEYYLKAVFPVHHDRAVEEATISKMLENLHLFPENLRHMYLHLWSIGLRLSEVCMIRGDAYYQRKDDTWIKLYQNKMKAEKTVPIPSELYKLMKAYIEKKQIMPDEYVFQNAKGGAFDVNTFIKQMVKKCDELGIRCSEYTFRSHDYRHTVATSLYAHGASIQAIRDYMGHKKEDMTKQYLDYMPEKIDKANDEYFGIGASSFARKMKKGGRHGKSDLSL